MHDTTVTRSVRYDSVAGTTGASERHSLQTYVSDLLALERHIREPIVRQSRLDAAACDPAAMRIMAQLDLMTDVHIEALETQLHQLGGDLSSPVQSALSALLGFGAAAIDMLRADSVSKNLRDDFAALSLASVTYTMLHTAALCFGDGSTAELAKRHLADVDAALGNIGRALPNAILQELHADGVTITPAARHSALLKTRDAWSDSGT